MKHTPFTTRPPLPPPETSGVERRDCRSSAPPTCSQIAVPPQYVRRRSRVDDTP
eukprot:CAMPEP_0183293446 /NCGR_PEP_ID=MMETSP0160_2-20130417/2128_1 /TAXON_ID=2839 ORGANISM="Odontella Sinensis, Strain Grunow 1884" /NCGR_SAMPLE_ID=MMETSP0160_2 /ASSEMBLY_ACC=CAM_ASM_000250 /LENGTH=53 /DNA_ID=CAMNT_0025454563 /DNA_START=289 /DNA_END=447 /DNA_ORIENTATION=+